MKTVRVIGAGMNGLLSAYYLVEKGFTVEVYEKLDREGGMIQTIASGPHTMETAANAVLADAEVEAVAEKIGLVLTESRRDTSARWIYRGGLKRWPLGVASTLRIVLFLILKKMFPSHVQPRSGESLLAWGKRILGDEATTYLLEPACAGIFGATPRDLSATLIYNYFFAPRKRAKGRLRHSVRAEGGMGNFPRFLRRYLQSRGVVFHFSTEPQGQPPGETVIATHVSAAAELLKAWKDPRGEKLAQIPLVDLMSVNAFYRREEPVVKGFGVLFPRPEGVLPLGVLFSDFIFSNPNATDTHSNTWIFGGRSPQSVCHLSEAEILNEIQKVRVETLKMPTELITSRINRWPGGLPLYGVELEAVLKDLPVSLGRLHLMGNYLGEIGLNRFFHRAKHLAERLSEASYEPR